MSSASGEREMTRLGAVLAENAAMRLELEAVRAERNWLEAELRRVTSAGGGESFWNGTLHDFRNLLTVISGHSELMLKRLDESDPLWRSADAVRKAAESGNALTQHLLEANRRVELPAEVVDLNEVVASVARMLEGTLAVGVDLVTRLDRGLGRVQVNPAQIEQVLVNLAVNARDAMPDGGRLTIETANAEFTASRGWGFANLRPGLYTVVAVSDTGSGMEPWIQSRLFQPYFTTKGGKGTGLGLATAHLIVKRHGGHITVTSAAGEGSTFRVYLPRVPEAELADEAGDARVRGSETILVVDDEPELRELMREILELHGYTVLDARDAGEGLRMAEGHEGPLHLVIADVTTPGMRLGDFIAALARLRPGARALCVSGHAEEEISRRVGPLPGPLLTKPFAVGALAEKVREVLDAS
jgi:signal transduction histidine kinase